MIGMQELKPRLPNLFTGNYYVYYLHICLTFAYSVKLLA